MPRYETTQEQQKVLWSMVPRHLQEGIDNYVSFGIPNGSFLTALFEGRVFDAVGRADTDSFEGLNLLIAFIAKYLPEECYGSKEAVAEWIGSGGLANR